MKAKENPFSQRQEGNRPCSSAEAKLSAISRKVSITESVPQGALCSSPALVEPEKP